MGRQLKYHEQKLLKKVDLLEWRKENNLHEIKVIRRYRIPDREQYHKYNRLAGHIRRVVARLKKRPANDPYRMKTTTTLLDKLFHMGLIQTKKSLLKAEEVNVSAFCRRRLPVVMVRVKMAESIKEATTFVEQGHIRVGPTVVTDPAFLVTRPMEDFVTWVDSSKIKRHIQKYNDKSSYVSVDKYTLSITASTAIVEIDLLSMETADNKTFSDVNTDCDSAYIDPQVYVFKKLTDGSLSFVASNDDAGDDNPVYASRGRSDGSVSGEDSYLIQQLAKGTYVIAVGRYPLSQSAAAAGKSTDSITSFTPYTCMARKASYGNYKMTVRTQSSATKSAITKKANSHSNVKRSFGSFNRNSPRTAHFAIDQDVAVVNANAGRRGLSGTVFVHKLAGAAAKAGKDLASLVEMVNGLMGKKKLGTMGVAIKPCTLPGQEDNARQWGDNEMEVGLGIHGEPGIAKCEQQDVPSLCNLLVEKITTDTTSVGLGLNKGSKCVLMVNNLGSTTGMELYVVAKYAVQTLRAKGIEPERVLVGSFMTALDMAGFSLSLWNSNGDAEMLALFDALTTAPAWTYSTYALSQSAVSGPFIKAEVPTQAKKTFERPAELSNSGRLLEKCILAVCDVLIKSESELTNWDTKVGDGDCGTTFKNAAEAILEDLQAHYPLNDATLTLRALADSVGRSAGGTSGVLYVIFLTAGSLYLEGCKEVDTAAWVGAFRAGITAVQKYGGAKEGSRTMVDALVPSLRALDNPASNTGTELATAAAKAAQQGAEATAHISTKKAFGRAGYVGEEFGAGIPDPGAKAAAFWIQAIADTVNSS
ncbi:hypothetical protein G195_006823 [Phytophthora kernoviae 00238/432]|uniref:U3 small nucleolar ribonucleoprotein protein IMP3 n=2 Tax=Phytophthora kernoviae TaxID=325452 RepID=A0A8J4WAE3_9STRA|nr:hypothetical protein G195_006823 [Phytophthora kernoviae 00238/432]